MERPHRASTVRIRDGNRTRTAKCLHVCPQPCAERHDECSNVKRRQRLCRMQGLLSSFVHALQSFPPSEAKMGPYSHTFAWLRTYDLAPTRSTGQPKLLAHGCNQASQLTTCSTLRDVIFLKGYGNANRVRQSHVKSFQERSTWLSFRTRKIRFIMDKL